MCHVTRQEKLANTCDMLANKCWPTFVGRVSWALRLLAGWTKLRPVIRLDQSRAALHYDALLPAPSSAQALSESPNRTHTMRMTSSKCVSHCSRVTVKNRVRVSSRVSVMCRVMVMV